MKVKLKCVRAKKKRGEELRKRRVDEESAEGIKVSQVIEGTREEETPGCVACVQNSASWISATGIERDHKKDFV